MQFLVKIIKDTRNLKKGDTYRVSKQSLAYNNIVELEEEIFDKNKYKNIPFLKTSNIRNSVKEIKKRG